MENLRSIMLASKKYELPSLFGSYKMKILLSLWYYRNILFHAGGIRRIDIYGRPKRLAFLLGSDPAAIIADPAEQDFQRSPHGVLLR